MALIIVESPTKARTFNRILKGKDFFVFATMGHIRDLPSSKLSIDYKKNFAPKFTIIKNKQKIVDELTQLAKKNKEVILATDPDREGESIAYHVAYLLGYFNENWPEVTYKTKTVPKRIVFHEITARALEEALSKPENFRIDLVKSQFARRILDRIVGYELSPLLWKKMGKNWLSAGRVQTVALRLIVEREKEIKKFVTEPYFQIYADFIPDIEKAHLTSKHSVAYEQKFRLDLFAGTYQYTKTTITKESVSALKNDIASDKFKVLDVKESVQNRYPPPPFTTSLLQQDGFQKFGFSAKMTMRLAQDLYERGLITYHRTDSFNLASQFVFAAHDYITKTYGTQYALDKPRGYKTKSKSAQEAHEAIRPTNLITDPDDMATDKKMTVSHKKLYQLIFNRAVATQMKEAAIKSLKITIVGAKGYQFEADQQKVLFDGFLKIVAPDFSDKNQKLALVKIGDTMKLQNLTEQESMTKPPPRYNEASLIKILEEKGIGRPSTYAPIISLIQDKNYVEKENRNFLPTSLGVAISDYLSVSFPDIFELNFTASMENGLDEIANGGESLSKLLTTFNKPFQKELAQRKEDKTFIDVQEKVDEKCPQCGSPLMMRYSKFGKFLGCSNYPTCKFTKPFLQVVPEKFCPQDHGRIVVRFTRSRKKFFGCENYPKCQWSAWKLTDVKS